MSAADDTDVKLYEAYVMFFGRSRTELTFKIECYDFSTNSITGSISLKDVITSSIRFYQACIEANSSMHVLSHENLLELLKMILLFSNTPYDRDYNISFHFVPTWYVCDKTMWPDTLKRFQDSFTQ